MYNQRMTSLISFAISVAFWFMLTNSLAMALGILLLILIHEMGHFFAARYKGLSVSLPVFTPLGAAVNLQGAGSAKNEAFVAYAGPLVGGIASLICLALAPVLGSNLLFSLGFWGVVINVFNLVPLEPLDGGKIALVIDRRAYFLGVPLFIYCMMQIGLSMFNLFMAVLILQQAWQAIQMRNSQADVMPYYFKAKLGVKIAYGAAYAALAALLTWVAMSPSSFMQLLVVLGW